MFARILLLALLATTGNVTVDAVYPNPATPGDAGEFVVLDVPEEPALANTTLTDGEDTISLDGLPTGRRVAVAGTPMVARNLTDLPIYQVETPLALRNGGEAIQVRVDGTNVSTLRYPSAPEAKLYRDGVWAPLGRSDFAPVTAQNVSSTVFVLPDSAAPFRRAIGGATDRVLLAGYTFSDPEITDTLLAAHRRGVDVAVLLEGGPVGGITAAQVEQVDRLEQAGIPVSLMGTERARYDFHHAKYAVVDDHLVVASENWKPGGTGGHGSRGWAVTLRDERLATDLATVFQSDTGWVDSQSWADARPADPIEAPPDNTTFPERFAPETFDADRATLFVAPDNAAAEMRALLDGAEESIWVEQVSIQRDGLLMDRTIAAARRGVNVRILVSGAWFVESENRAFVDSVRRRARAEDLPITVRMVEPRSRFEYVHTKGVVVDGRSVVVGSLNWNQHALTENREVAVRIDDPAAADYFERTFLADWRGAAWRIQWGVLAASLLAVLVGGSFAVQFGTFEKTAGRWRGR